MKTLDSNLLRRGLTLFEVLGLVFVFGVLLVILMPTIGNIESVGGRSPHQMGAREIAQAYLAYTTSGIGKTPRMIQTPGMSSGSASDGVAANIEDVAFILAKYTQLNDASVWYIRTDENLRGAQIPHAVIIGDPAKATGVSLDFQKTSPKAWAFVTGLSVSAPASTTPLLWTYGLGHDGKWAADSPWKGRGGHIAFLDGHVDWCEKLSLDPGGESFVTYQTLPNNGGPTVDYFQAINSGGTNPAIVVNAMGQ